MTSSSSSFGVSTSSSSSLSSSSSSSEFFVRGLYGVLVHQEHHNLIPFSLIAESAVSSGGTITFELESAKNYFDYEILVGNTNPEITTYDAPGYVPHDEYSQYEHKNSFHVEIMAKDASGLKDYNVRMQEEIYGYKSPEDSFNVPKFTWSNDIFGSNSVSIESSSEDPISGGVWIGNSENTLKRFQYDSESITETFSSAVASAPHTIYFPDSNETYLTAYDHLMELLIDDFYGGGNVVSEAYTSMSILNNDNDVITLKDDNIWTVQAYSGKVVKRSTSTMGIISEFDGFDAPHKILWSEYHQAYLVAGTNILWKLVNGVKEAIYNIRGYDIADFSVSPSGYVCLVFDGDNNDIIRILKPDLFSIAMSETISNGTARYCTYCDQGIFYILVELSGSSVYNFMSYVFDSKNNILRVVEGGAAEPYTTTTTTTSGISTNKVQVKYPSNGEWIVKGEEIEILWGSIESATDQVKIELYKGGILEGTITKATSNTGVYKWTPTNNLVNGIDYQIKITWIAATELPEHSDIGKNFSISDIVTTTTTTTTQSINYSVGISFNSGNRHIVNVLTNGLVGIIDLNDMTFYGLFDTGVSDVTCMAVRDDSIDVYSSVSAIRVFVGSEEYLSDKWDSGIIETNKNSIYYGGGNNLEPGEKYYVNIQVRDDRYGWSGVQTKEWVMPR